MTRFRSLLRRGTVGAFVALSAVSVRPQGARAADPVAERVGAVVGARTSKTLRVSAAVWDARTGERLHGTNADVPRRPASVAKLATTAAAFIALGPDHELRTDVFATAKPDASGTVRGSLVVRGGGDPGYSEHLHPDGADGAMRELAKAVAAAGVRRVTGDIVLDATRYVGPDRQASWGWREGQWADYMAPVTALTFNDGCADIRFVPGASPGSAATVTVEPPTTLLTIVGRVATGAARTKNDATIGVVTSDGRVPVQGSVPLGSSGFRTSIAAIDPVAYFGDAFRRALRVAGVQVDGANVPVRSPAAPGGGPSVAPGPGGGLTLLARRGTAVARIVAVANTRSQNLYAELLCREIGAVRANEGSFAAGGRAVAAVHGHAADSTALHLADGSGLARDDRASADAVGAILLAMARSPHDRAFTESLAKAGDAAGTLRDRFQAPKFRDRVQAKTGTLRDTKALAGYVLGRSGRRYAFAILCEGDNGRARDLQDDVVEVLVEQ